MAETRALKRIVKNLEAVKDKVARLGQNIKITEVKTGLAMISDEWKDFQNIEAKMGGEFGDASLDIANKIERLYFDMKVTLYEYEKSHEVENARQSEINMGDLMANQSQFINELSSLNRRDAEVKLPRVNIPVFTGDYAEFPSFKDLFEASIHTNETISPVHKLQYLKGVLKGDAFGLIKHLTVTAANYEQAWEKIKERYNKPKHVICSLLKKFIEQPSIKHSSAKAFRQLVDTSDEVIRGLRVLGEQAERRDPWLVYILANKLDDESREAWAHESVAESYPSLESLFRFLSKRSDALECLSSTQRSRQAMPKRVGVMVSETTTVIPCILCSGDHYISKCSRYLDLPIDKRKELDAEKKLCFNCLSSKHQAVVCKSKFLCRICRCKHHVTLHLEQTKGTMSDNEEKPKPNSNEISESSVHVAVNYENNIQTFQAILPTVIVLVKDRSGQPQRCRALLDSGSQSSFITEACAQRLRLKRERANTKITGLTSGNMMSKSRATVVMQSLYNSTIKVMLEVLIINHLPTCLPKTTIRLDREAMLNDLELADPRFNIPGSIDLLIGADKFFEILKGEQQRRGSMILNKTMFGWIISGQPRTSNPETTEAFTIQTEDTSTIDQTLRRFWEIEEVPTSEKMSQEDKESEQLFVKTHERRGDGRYVVKLPFKKDCTELGDSLQMATNRFRSIERKFLSNPMFRDAYVKQIREYISLGHMRELPQASYNAAECYYLPHHAVVKENGDTTKLRVVFDGSAKSSNGISLNDRLIVGPTIQPTLWEILLRFRAHKIALVADIEKMYRQVFVSEEHQHYQTILWRENPGDKLRHYHLTRVTFGLACSAFLAIRTLQQMAEDSEEDTIKQRIIRDFHVDDLLTGSNDKKEAANVKEKLTSTLMRGGFHLTKWRSNVAELSEETNEIAVSDIGDDSLSTVKTLGLQWHPGKDTFTFKVLAERDGAINKRKIISEFSRLFDPLGFLSPSTILLKILFQKLWLIKVNWDDKLPIETEEEYRRIRGQFVHFQKIIIPRLIEYSGKVQIHGFSDASEAAYCAAIYIRTVKDNGEITSQLLTSKTKVAPIKQISIPRLELCAAHLLTKLILAVKGTLTGDVQYFAWSDSTIVLSWLSTHPTHWKTFIANRTSEILDCIPRKHWAHVKSKDNPADHGSRGVTPEKLSSLTQWWKGPEWLSQPQELWPTSNEKEHVRDEVVEMEYRKPKSRDVFYTETKEEDESWLTKLFERQSRLSKIFRVVAYVFRYVEAIKFTAKGQELIERHRSTNKISQLTAIEIENANMECVRWVQRKMFEADIKSLRCHRRVAEKSKLLSLAPFIDDDDILRVGGRLQNADYDYDGKHPMILPQQHIFTARVIWDTHISNLHSGPTLTASLIRQRYWIIKGRSKIRNLLNQCVVCKKYAATTTKQLMGNLPNTRITLTRPFENTGIDFAGPIYLKARKGRGHTIPTKGYICIFVCLSIKAIHIEGVTDMTSEAFLAALRRFTARRGVPRRIYTDNGSNFVGSKRILDKAYKLISNINDDYIVSEFLSRNRIQWSFIPPAASHFGGLWEAAVKSVKGHLLKATRNINMTFEEMTTLLCQIENVLNSRPLCTTSTDDDYLALTPAHFLITSSAESIPELAIESPENRLTRWKVIQSRIQTFWKRYHIEYVNNMQQRHKWRREHENTKVGDIVLIKEDHIPVARWLLGLIIKVHPGEDDLVRAATVKTVTNIIQRPVVKLCKLPVS